MEHISHHTVYRKNVNEIDLLPIVVIGIIGFISFLAWRCGTPG
jgi:hypothetical protein